MTQGEVLIIEDDRKTAELMRLYLERAGFAARVTHDGMQGLLQAQATEPDAIVLDLMLPGMDGLDVCHALRASGSGPGVPILMLTARSTEDDLILGLEVGADDYLTKPFSPRELVARVRALVRRNGSSASEAGPLQVGDLLLDFTTRDVRLAGAHVDVTPVEFKLLAVLIGEPGRVFSRQELLDRLFGLTYDGLPRTIDVHILRLRKKLEPDPQSPRYLQTVYGHGYRLASDTADNGEPGYVA